MAKTESLQAGGCQPNYPTALNGECISTALSVFTGQSTLAQGFGAGYHLAGYFGGAYFDDRLPLLDEATATDLEKLAQAIRTAPEALIFGGPDPKREALDFGTLMKFLLPLLEWFLKRRAGG